MSDTNATCDEVEAALFEALRPLAADATPTPGPFVRLLRAGRIESFEDFNALAGGTWPSCALAFERSQPEGIDGVFAQNGGHAIETVERLMFGVYIGVACPKRPEVNVKGVVGAPGALALAQRVKEALTGLEIPGLFDNDVVHLVGHTVFASRVDSYLVHLVSVSARTELPPSDLATTPGTPFVTDADARLPGTDTDGAVVHLSAGRAPRT